MHAAVLSWNVNMASAEANSADAISAVGRLPRRIQMTFGGGPSNVANSAKSLSCETS